MCSLLTSGVAGNNRMNSIPSCILFKKILVDFLSVNLLVVTNPFIRIVQIFHNEATLTRSVDESAYCHDLDHHQANKKKRKPELPYRSSYEGHISIGYGRGREYEVCFYLISIYTYILLRQDDNRYFTCGLLGQELVLCLTKMFIKSERW